MKTKPLTQADILDRPNIPPAVHPSRIAREEGTLTALTDELRALAESIHPGAAELTGWHRDQLAALRAESQRYADAMLRNGKLMAGASPDDPRWPRYWELDARYRYAEETRAMVTRRGHVLACENHGVDGVDMDADWYVPLSLRGLLAGEGTTGWARACGRCARPGPIAAEARQLMKNWRQG